MGQSLHVVPVNDLYEHPTDSATACPCHPKTEPVAGGQVVVHNAWDKRELRETKASG